MKVVLDTNALLVSISRRSRFHPVFEAFENGHYELLVTTDILNEYEEVIGEEMGAEVAQLILDGFHLVPNVVRVTRYYQWNLITADPDDNKFVDCAVAGNADFIVTNDRHFRVLQTVQFPSVKSITLEEFFEIITGQSIDLV